MNLVTMMSIGEEIAKHLENFKVWLSDNYTNPVIWIAFFGLGLFLFEFTYSSLQKEK